MCGLYRGDQIVAVDGKPVGRSGSRLLAARRSRARWWFTIRRDGATMRLELPGRLYDDSGDDTGAAINELLQPIVDCDAFPLAYIDGASLGRAR